MKLTRDDWVDAAYEAMLDAGPQAVAVATLSKGLHATRGSFYHYFDDRDALLHAVLERWEHEAVDAFILRSADAAEPAARLEGLLAQVFREPTRLAVVERHLLASRSDIPVVAEAVARVIDRRLAHLTDCYRELGFTAGDAADRASIAYTMFTGWLYLDPSPPTLGSDLDSGSGSDLERERLAELIRGLLVVEAP